MSDHLTPEQFDRLMCGKLSPGELRSALLHFLNGCAPCSAKFGALLDLAEGSPAALRAGGKEIVPSGSERYDAAIDRAFAVARRHHARLARERASVRRGLTPYLLSPGGLATFLGRHASRRQGWALCEVLIEASHEVRFDDPRHMLLLALLAKTVAERSSGRRYGLPAVKDLQAAAWAELGNAERVNDRLEDAMEAMDVALAKWEEGTGDPLLLARILDLTAMLYSAQRRFAEAQELLERVHRLYLDLGEDHLAGRVLVNLAISANYSGDSQEALRLLRQAVSLIDAHRDPKLAVIAKFNLMDFLVDAGEFREARRLLLTSGLRAALGSDRLNLAKLRWNEAKIAAGLGDLSRAETAFLQTREQFTGLDLPYKAALVSLDLAEVWLRQGKARQVGSLVEEILATFRALRIGREAVASLILLSEACRLNRVTVGLVQEVVSFLSEADLSLHEQLEEEI
ncbi:MAG TPA: tetratricopeptide repeat protein [Thermoanaerobaculia bacterium]|nr:tetratricopeptide repeat protein [Thermoanaerobaculia bacterium]